MIYKLSGRKYYRVKFQFKGETIHKCTRATDAKTARSIEGTIRSELAKGNWGILERKPAPSLKEFLTKEFLPFARTRCGKKPKTVEYYEYGADRLSASDMASLRISEITGKHATQFAARHSTLAASTINCGLRTLRRALNLAFEWGKLDRPVRVPLAKGERQRDRILTDAEITLYLNNCRQPWKDAATLILGTGMRPGEVYRLRWEFVLLNGSGGLIQVSEGKSKAARRLLPMIAEVYAMLKARHEAQGRPAVGWVFPTGAKGGHLEQGTGKTQHSAAITKVNAETLKANVKRATAGEKPLPLPLPAFEPYVMRHTALTRMAPLCDAFTLARIAGHSSITITQRYCHPQADAVDAAFSKFGNRKEVVTEGGHHEKQLPAPSEDAGQLTVSAA
ncbi:MAG: site-specific integrase, partial [Terriglobales bacterium]